MKVAFLIHSLEASSSRYRVVQYVPFFKEQGLEVSIHFYKRGWRDKFEFYRTLDRYDILYILRKLFLPPEFWYIRKRARRIVYDFDDAVMYRSSGSKSPYSFSRRLRFAYMIKRVDDVIAGNEFLKSEALRYNDRVTVVPTSVDLSGYPVKGDGGSGGSITIGWLGSGSTLKYLKPLVPALEKIYRRYPNVQLKIVCDQFLDGLNLPVIKKQWSSEEEVSDLMSFDIGVMPLLDDLWSRGKCGLKILQYYGVGVPVICTPVGVNREIVKDGISGFWAEDEDQWEEKLLTLIREEGLRREMGLRGRLIVKEGYSLEANAPRLLTVIKEVVEKG